MSDAQKLDNQLCFALYAASPALTSACQPMLDALELLWEEDGARVAHR